MECTVLSSEQKDLIQKVLVNDEYLNTTFQYVNTRTQHQENLPKLQHFLQLIEDILLAKANSPHVTKQIRDIRVRLYNKIKTLSKPSQSGHQLHQWAKDCFKKLPVPEKVLQSKLKPSLINQRLISNFIESLSGDTLVTSLNKIETSRGPNFIQRKDKVGDNLDMIILDSVKKGCLQLKHYPSTLDYLKQFPEIFLISQATFANYSSYSCRLRAACYFLLNILPQLRSRPEFTCDHRSHINPLVECNNFVGYMDKLKFLSRAAILELKLDETNSLNNSLWDDDKDDEDDVDDYDNYDTDEDDNKLINRTNIIPNSSSLLFAPKLLYRGTKDEVEEYVWMTINEVYTKVFRASADINVMHADWLKKNLKDPAYVNIRALRHTDYSSERYTQATMIFELYILKLKFNGIELTEKFYITSQPTVAGNGVALGRTTATKFGLTHPLSKFCQGYYENGDNYEESEHVEANAIRKSTLESFEKNCSINANNFITTNEIELPWKGGYPPTYPIIGTRYPIQSEDIKIVKKKLEGLLKDNKIVIDMNRSHNNQNILPLVLELEDNEVDVNLYVDCKKLNEHLQDPQFTTPLPKLVDYRKTLSDKTIFTKLKLYNAYDQFKMSDNAQKYLRFSFEGVVYKCKSSVFRLKHMTYTIQNVLSDILSGVRDIVVYVDTIVIGSVDHKRHISTLLLVLRRLQKFNVKLDARETKLAFDKMNIFGHFFQYGQVSAHFAKVRKIMDSPSWFKTIWHLRRFLGLTDYLSRYVKNYALISAPLRDDLVKVENRLKTDQAAEFFLTLSTEASEALDQLKDEIRTRQPLFIPQGDQIILRIEDISTLGISLSLFEEEDSRPLGYYSRKLKGIETRYSPLELAVTGIVEALSHLSDIIQDQPVYIECNHELMEFFECNDLGFSTSRKRRRISRGRVYDDIDNTEEYHYHCGNTTVLQNLISKLRPLHIYLLPPN